MRESRNKTFNKRVDEINTSDPKKCSRVKDNKKTTIGVKKNARGDCSVSGQSSNRDMLPTSASCSSPTKSDYSEESGTDHSGSSNTGTNSSGNVGSRSNLPSTSNKKHSSGGIKFYAGLRLEAKDLGNDIWYAVKVVEVDQEEDEILIHFEKWSQRYDEWIPMDSSRLRPIQDQPGGYTKKNAKVFKVGDNVMATWSDSRKYPAKVKTVLGNDRYEVLFFDGFTKNIKGGRMTILSNEELAKIEQLKPGIGPSNDRCVNTPPASFSSRKYPSGVVETTLGTKEERRERKRKLNVAELFHFKKRRRVDNPSVRVPMAMTKNPQQGNLFSNNRGGKKQAASEGILPISDGNSSKLQITKTDIAEMSGDKFIARSDVNVDFGGNKKRESIIKTNVGDTSDKNKKKSKLDVSSQGSDKKDSKLLFTKNVKRKFNKFEGGRKPHSIGASSRKEGGEETTKTERRDEAPEPALKPQEEWVPQGHAAYVVDGTGGRRKSIVVDDPRVPAGWSRHFIQRMSGHSAGKWDVFFVCPQGRKFRTRHELRSYYEGRGEVFPTEQFDFSLGRRKNKSNTTERDASATSDGHLSASAKQSSSSLALPLSSNLKAISTETPVRRVKTLLPRVRASDSVGALQSSDNDTLDDQSNISDSSVVFGDLKIEKENDAYKCPKEGCCKTFRKENLLQMHMKHYHPEYNRFVASTPNVADLAYARTIGEPVEELHPRTPRPSLMQKISRFEAMRRARANTSAGVTSPAQNISYSTPHQSPSVLHASANSIPDTPGMVSHGHSNLSEHHSTPTSVRSIDNPASELDVDPVTLNASLSVSGLNLVVPKRTIRTLMPVTRTSVSESAVDMTDDTSDVVDVTEVTPSPRISLSTTEQDMEPIDVKGVKRSHTPPLILPYVSMGHTKSLRIVRRRHMSDFHMEPVMKKRKPIENDESTQNTLVAGSSSRQTRVETLRREELVNCTCGYPEEDGLMIQCDLCMCWQHGLCNNIEHEDDVPEKYVCVICLHPPRERPSKHFLHDQDWLKEGRLPSLSFRSKSESDISQRTAILKRSHDLIGTILQLQRVIQSLRVKVNIAEMPDHPKLYLWNQSWEKSNLYSNPSNSHISAQQNINVQPPVIANFKDEKCFDQNNLNISQLEKSPRPLCLRQAHISGSVGHDADGDLTECHSTDLEGETSDICPVRENANLLADDCDTKDTYFSQDSISSVKGENMQLDLQQSKTIPKENLPQMSDDLILDNTINVGNETEVVTVSGSSEKGEDNVAENRNEVESNLQAEEEHTEKGNVEKLSNVTNASLSESSHKYTDPNKEIGHIEDNELQLPFCQKDLMHLATSMANKLESFDVPEESQPSVLAQQRAPQPEAPIVPRECRKTLLDHIEAFHQQLELRLTSLETQIAGLESMDPYLAHDESTDNQTRETVQMLLHDLSVLRDVAALN